MEEHKPYREERPWGSFLKFTENEPCTVKIITINPEASFSKQTHHEREEFWHVVSGNGIAEIGNEKKEIIPGEEFLIPKEQTHRITAGTQPVVLLEISRGHFDESDITRLEDHYGRV